jgi:hypothetical protein
LRDDGVDLDLPSCEEIEGALKYLKNNKAAVADSIAWIQQAWTSETLPRSWTEGVLCPVYKKGDKLDCKHYGEICYARSRSAGTIYTKETQLIAYADDIDIVGRSQSAVQDAYLALEREAPKVEFKKNEQKTKIYGGGPE